MYEPVPPLNDCARSVWLTPDESSCASTKYVHSLGFAPVAAKFHRRSVDPVKSGDIPASPALSAGAPVIVVAGPPTAA
jgi:hypothetical protein